MTVRADLNIDGIMGGAGGGLYRNVTINGHGSVNGNIDCATFTSNGRSVVRGEVVASGQVDVNGLAVFEQDVEAGYMHVNGKAEVGGFLGAGRLRVDGHMKVGAGLSGESVEVNGYLGVKGSLEAESFRSCGSFRVDGLLNIGSLQAELYAGCQAKEIGGETIEVRKPSGNSPFGQWVRSLIFGGDHLIAETIEGDDIYLESTKAGVVRGKRVKLGPGCEIGVVEYSESYDQHPEAKVTDSRRIG
ncbi:polymer-forming cytoskeletal protein [Paenibacillus filicis]|uniref:Polymer-forming cytoskeletal protein n=1 Tax=Paenibacillus filicis TaxID=669464 RepID=A0ABU9DRI1_9BACL